MAMQEIYEPIEVQARTFEGKPVPIQVLWKRKNYAVAKVESSKTKRQKKGGRVEEIVLSTIVWRQMKIEFDYTKRAWRLLALEEV